MTRFSIRILSLFAAVVSLAGAAHDALACRPPCPSDSPYSIEVLVDGQARPEYVTRGVTYIEALPQREYAVRLSNRTGERIAVALSVDGLNSIDATSSSMRQARKWILDPYDSIVIDGWQTSAQTARKFFFTREDRSYGAWLGKTENLGVIAAAFFRQRQSEPQAKLQRREEKRQVPDPSAPMQDGAASERSPADSKKGSDELAATGIGRELPHPVVRVEFDEAEIPAAVFSVRYEYRDALVSLGVLPQRPERNSLMRRERARGFDDQGFAPDPYR